MSVSLSQFFDLFRKYEQQTKSLQVECEALKEQRDIARKNRKKACLAIVGMREQRDRARSEADVLSRVARACELERDAAIEVRNTSQRAAKRLADRVVRDAKIIGSLEKRLGDQDILVGQIDTLLADLAKVIEQRDVARKERDKECVMNDRQARAIRDLWNTI